MYFLLSCPRESLDTHINYIHEMFLQYYTNCVLLIDVSVSFNQSTYSVDEDDGPAQPVLVLSNPSSTDITVHVRSNDITATGE